MDRLSAARGLADRGLAETATDLHIQLVEQRGALNRLIAEFRELVEQVGLI